MNEFEKLECANAQMDIWIDEEEYDRVINSCEIDPELKVYEEKKKTLQDMFETAFSDESCTAKKDAEWLSILNHSSCPISSICNIPQEGDRIDLVSPDYDAWSRFFWAKLIRARIQQKGTDCFYRRLDEVVAYLERHLPLTGSHKLQSVKIAVIYLLEMAAAGLGVDQQSFAERARRILRDKFPEDDPFFDFYDLLARYNIGTSYFHEARYRKAVLEFNWIIDKLRKLASQGDDLNIQFARKRLAKDLLYLPSVLYRAETQLKLQLAYHTLEVLAEGEINGLFKTPSQYKAAKACLIRAEGYLQMKQLKRFSNELTRVVKFLSIKLGVKLREDVLKWQHKEYKKLAEIHKVGPRNLKGQMLALMMMARLQQLKGNISKTEWWHQKRKTLPLLSMYEESAANQKPRRASYLQHVAEYLKSLVNTARDEAQKSEKYLEIARMVYEIHQKDLLQKEWADNKDRVCPCNDRGIDLRRLEAKHYDDFSEHMSEFYKGLKAEFKPDKIRFVERLSWLEEYDRENLEYRKWKLKLETIEDAPQKWGCAWCVECVPNRKEAFGGLLKCSDAHDGEEKQDNSLIAEDYEKIMNHWDDHFLEHMKDVSFHEPSRCRAIHFLGLQRWNSTSPAQGRSLGGGYLIYHTDKGCVDLGIAVDPGFDFVRNLFHVGYSLSDIDVVLLSHAHVDHVRDFESIVSLLLELRKRTNKKIQRKVHAIMTLGVYRRLEYLIESPGLREFIEPYIMDIEKEIDTEFLSKCKFIFIPDPDKANNVRDSRPRFMPVLHNEDGKEELRLEITPTRAYHNDFSEYSDSFGFKINIKDPKVSPQMDYTLGYTGDTSWNQDIMNQYKKCDALLVHLGSLIDREKKERREFDHYRTHKECFELIREKNHPYLMGMLHFVTEIDGWDHSGKKPLVLMSEFGEEMRGKIRLDFIKRLKKAYRETFNVLPVDIGLDVLLAEGACEGDKDYQSLLEDSKAQVWCVQCKEFVSLERANFEHYGHDEALFCVCETCQKATPSDVLQERLRALYEIGRRLETGRQR